VQIDCTRYCYGLLCTSMMCVCRCVVCVRVCVRMCTSVSVFFVVSCWKHAGAVPFNK
jgi:hypothetical protein